MPLTINPVEKETLLQCLADSRNCLIESTQGLSDAQWHFTPAPGSWSVSQVLEHLTVLEGLFVDVRFPMLMQAPPSEPRAGVEQTDAIILESVPDRTVKITAPGPICPSGQCPPAELLERFRAHREKTMALARETDGLREHVAPHPVLGPLDAYQWLLAVAAHTRRHVGQIQEVKSNPLFPQA